MLSVIIQCTSYWLWTFSQETCKSGEYFSKRFCKRRSRIEKYRKIKARELEKEERKKIKRKREKLSKKEKKSATKAKKYSTNIENPVEMENFIDEDLNGRVRSRVETSTSTVQVWLRIANHILSVIFEVCFCWY